jgi:dTDP-4-amino-4,6-dideoxygalactose transaminase
MLWINPSLADLAALSTYVAQIITTGEGGYILTTSNEEYVTRKMIKIDDWKSRRS